MAFTYRLRRAVMFALLVAAGFGLAPLAAAQVISPFLTDDVKLSAEDGALMRDAIRSVLESGKVDTTKSWTNPETGVSGTATLLKVYERDGAPCGEIEQVFTKPRVSRYILPFCQVPDGKWKLAF